MKALDIQIKKSWPMKNVYSKIDSFVKREWFLLIAIGAICVAIALFEVF